MLRLGSAWLALGALLVGVAAAPATANAAACCLSSSVFGIGRLAIWEEAALGLSSGFAATTGRMSADAEFVPLAPGVREDELTAELWALARIAEGLQLYGRLPWIVGLRAGSGGETSVGHGLGDVQAGLRFDAIGVGEYAELPGIAVTASVIVPSGRRPEAATDPLGASATGRGSTILGVGLALERAVLPWFVRAEVGGTLPLPFVRRDTGETQRFGPGVQAAVSGGVELIEELLVLGGQLSVAHETSLSLGGEWVPGTAATIVTASVSGALTVSPEWSLTAAVSTDVLGRIGLGRNRPERTSLVLGVRHALF